MQECFYGGLIFSAIAGIVIGAFAFNEPVLGGVGGLIAGIALGTFFHVDASKYVDDR